MQITHLEIYQVDASKRGNWIFVQLHTDAGLSGLGEASQSGNDGLVIAALQQLGPQLKGIDPTQVEAIWERLARGSAIFSGDAGRIGATALSAVDQALWDLAGKAMDVPAWKLMGGKRRDKIRLYANLNRGTDDRSPLGFANAARRAVDAGFQAVKSTPFDEVQWRRMDRDGFARDTERGIERLVKTREAIGDEIELLVDCHQRFDLATAFKVAEKLSPLNLYWFEEPVPRDHVDALRQLRLHSGQTIAGGEALVGREGFWDYIVQGAVDVLMPDVKHAGGITECRRIAALAEMAQMPIAPHSPAGPVSTMAGVHLAATVANFTVLEHAFGEVAWRGELVRPAENIVDGFITVPDAPGLGIELDEAVLAAHRLS
ncbi:MAG: mandelate racemase/muconate lactonizing enzyme family protein [Gemmatimonadetes bacterium]|nr:mandelate racemase/muconate lactonizing enzyme family protein [Gemmatimonadota bacterium]MBT5447705.1 mandelate racemase/muconate lactonizing enzyme family protein [Gemmatimonadota bacterium]MBT5803648.1 mandelate racemase/muconate lactonizing enzyme family protein [Gemmatimonadota bacterium]MBT6620718.1 mandelate racemase/muconate lactonizing enzyme family protein [Gemmatimonadota bacterium]MBT6903404.1 mandelate racemase/muconate lactonizing enzyme family protein [Gemmatimonadota bacterium